MAPRDRLLLLDVDGVTSPYKPVPDGEVARLGGLRLPYRPAVIDGVNRLIASGVGVIWLTTWESDLLPDLATALGLPELDVPVRVGEWDDGPSTWWRGWKTRTALAVVDELRPGRWAWADDDLRPGTIRRIRQSHPEGKVVSPDGDIGLTEDELAVISDWLKAQ